jgi:hypothetical protein
MRTHIREGIHGRLGVQRAAQSASSQRVADAHVLVSGHSAVGHLVVDLLVQDLRVSLLGGVRAYQTASGGAALASSTNSGEQNRADHHLHIGVVHGHDGVVAAQLQQGATKAALDSDADLASHVRAAGERNQVHAGILRYGLAARVRECGTESLPNVASAADGRADGARQVVASKNVADNLGHSHGAEGRGGGALPQVHVTTDLLVSMAPSQRTKVTIKKMQVRVDFRNERLPS